MSFWDDYLSGPPFEVISILPGDSADSHFVLWRGHEDFDVKELWDFDSGMRWHGRPPSLPNFVKYGGETLCGLGVESGRICTVYVGGRSTTILAKVGEILRYWICTV